MASTASAMNGNSSRPTTPRPSRAPARQDAESLPQANGVGATSSTRSSSRLRSSTSISSAEPKEKLKDAQRTFYSFWAPEIKNQRKAYLITTLSPVIMVMIVMWICLPVYWGALSNATKRTSHLEAWFINRDASSLGNALWSSFSNTSTPGMHLGWVNIDPASVGSDQDVANFIVDDKAWVAIVVEEGATERLHQARVTGDSTYDPRSAISVYYAQARQENAVGTYVLPITTQLLTQTVTQFATRSVASYLAEISSSGSVNQTALQLLSQAPQTLSPAISWETFNLRPYTNPIAQAVTLVGNIYLIIFSFVATMAHSGARLIIAPHIKFTSYLKLRVFVPLLVYIPLSMSYALVSLAYDLPFGGKFSYGGGFMLTFVFVYLGMMSLGLALEAMITLLTPRFISFFLFILIIFNISPTILPVELMHPFYRYGLGFPLYNLSLAIRTIFFDTKSELGQNAGIIIAWIALSCFTVTLFTWLIQRREYFVSEVDEEDKPVPEMAQRTSRLPEGREPTLVGNEREKR